jgi:hypothetical protein
MTQRMKAKPGRITSRSVFQQIADTFIVKLRENPVQPIVSHDFLQKFEKNTPGLLHHGILLTHNLYHTIRF